MHKRTRNIENEILNLLLQYDIATSKGIIKSLSDNRQARKILTKLVEDGVVVKIPSVDLDSELKELGILADTRISFHTAYAVHIDLAQERINANLAAIGDKQHYDSMRGIHA